MEEEKLYTKRQLPLEQYSVIRVAVGRQSPNLFGEMFTANEYSEICDALGEEFAKSLAGHYKNCDKVDYLYLIILTNGEQSVLIDSVLGKEEFIKKYKSVAKFSKKERSSFKYWFAHWCGFQLTALNLGIWKPKYLLHDIEKPWLKLLWRGDYKKVQIWHRTHNKHHLEYGLLNGWDAIDWEALMIDWECCGLSKQEAQMDARETLEYEIDRIKWKPYANKISLKLTPLLNKYNL